MLKRIKKIVIKLSIRIVLSLLYDPSLYCRHRFVIEIILSCSPSLPEIFAKRLFVECSWFDESCIETGLTYEIVLDCEGKRSYSAIVHIMQYN